ncbi:hypothetical protein C7H62_1762 [Mesoflavibacter sp. HG96]|uniref:DUF2892 domain-containing protein n=2 Tax=Mesoflavibacter profundi TaxID=2708110 RepID=A0ABT4S3Y8_9FLAO|nr:MULTISPECIES: DUF2892 domain-containing protein [Mesoflavibacter]MDA0178633.1 DUF2892 domain-containing protein [Mesoflavibacter profundi]QIJ89571.1 hypothetical protein C7H62_1762 [Mesoflavibacter sp. HG96]QIJ92299.1 hypothetical protein C7H56_1762 [Mesoflavibacter sp. HG37]
MNKNMGALDKSLRVLTAIIIAILYFLNVIEGTIAYILMVIAIIFLITSFINFCPIYSLIGINTCRKK